MVFEAVIPAQKQRMSTSSDLEVFKLRNELQWLYVTENRLGSALQMRCGQSVNRYTCMYMPLPLPPRLNRRT